MHSPSIKRNQINKLSKSKAKSNKYVSGTKALSSHPMEWNRTCSECLAAISDSFLACNPSIDAPPYPDPDPVNRNRLRHLFLLLPPPKLLKINPATPPLVSSVLNPRELLLLNTPPGALIDSQRSCTSCRNLSALSEIEPTVLEKAENSSSDIEPLGKPLGLLFVFIFVIPISAVIPFLVGSVAWCWPWC